MIDSKTVNSSFAGVRGPAWRWKLISSGALPVVMGKEADEFVRRGVDYVTLCRRGADGRGEAARRDPPIHAAILIEEAKDVIDTLRIMAIANCNRVEMACRTRQTEEAIEAWERLYFDVRDSLAATSWIAVHIIDPLIRSGNGWLASRLKLGLCGGPVAAAAILETDSETALTAADRLFQRHLRLQLKFVEAVSAPVGSERQALGFAKLFVELKHRERQLETERERLRARCQRDIHRHDEALRRLEVSLERGRRILEKRQWQRDDRILRQRHRKKEERQLYAAATEVSGDGPACPALSRLTWKRRQEDDVGLVGETKETVTIPFTVETSDESESQSRRSDLGGTAA